MLDEKTSNRITATFPIFTAHSQQIADRFYDNLFAVQPGLKRLFSTEFLHSCPKAPSPHTFPFPTKDKGMPAQSKILADSILFFCTHIGNPSACKPVMDRICAKHVSRMVQPVHYEVLLPVFESSIREVLADKISEEDFLAWLKAVKLVADILLSEEEKMYKALESTPGAWTGFRSFAASQLHDDYQSFYFGLTPTDGQPILPHIPGQKVCMRIETKLHGRIFADAVLPAYSLNTTNSIRSLRIETHQGLVYSNAAPNLNLDMLYVIELPKTTRSVSGSLGKPESSRLAVERLTKFKEIDISTPFGQGVEAKESRVTNSWDVARRNYSKRQTWDSFADYVDIDGRQTERCPYNLASAKERDFSQHKKE